MKLMMKVTKKRKVMIILSLTLTIVILTVLLIIKKQDDDPDITPYTPPTPQISSDFGFKYSWIEGGGVPSYFNYTFDGSTLIIDNIEKYKLTLKKEQVEELYSFFTRHNFIDREIEFKKYTPRDDVNCQDCYEATAHFYIKYDGKERTISNVNRAVDFPEIMILKAVLLNISDFPYTSWKWHKIDQSKLDPTLCDFTVEGRNNLQYDCIKRQFPDLWIPIDSFISLDNKLYVSISTDHNNEKIVQLTDISELVDILEAISK